MTALVTFPGGADVLEGAALPFAPGASPHTASAKLYRGVFRAIDKRWRGGRSAFLDAQIPSLRAFYDREWKDSDRVDAWPFFFAITELARHLGQTPVEYMNTAAIESARRDVSGAARHMLKLVSNRTITVGVFTMNKMWWDFLKFRTQALPNGIRINASGLPAGLRNGILILGGAYSAEVLRLSGTESARYEAGEFKCADTPMTPGSIGEGTFSLQW